MAAAVSDPPIRMQWLPNGFQHRDGRAFRLYASHSCQTNNGATFWPLLKSIWRRSPGAPNLFRPRGSLRQPRGAATRATDRPVPSG
jgi:hypothetical protein